MFISCLLQIRSINFRCVHSLGKLTESVFRYCNIKPLNYRCFIFDQEFVLIGRYTNHPPIQKPVQEIGPNRGLGYVIACGVGSNCESVSEGVPNKTIVIQKFKSLFPTSTCTDGRASNGECRNIRGGYPLSSQSPVKERVGCGVGSR